jgi:hypothetical protein
VYSEICTFDSVIICELVVTLNVSLWLVFDIKLDNVRVVIEQENVKRVQLAETYLSQAALGDATLTPSAAELSTEKEPSK